MALRAILPMVCKFALLDLPHPLDKCQFENSGPTRPPILSLLVRHLDVQQWDLEIGSGIDRDPVHPKSYLFTEYVCDH